MTKTTREEMLTICDEISRCGIKPSMQKVRARTTGVGGGTIQTAINEWRELHPDAHVSPAKLSLAAEPKPAPDRSETIAGPHSNVAPADTNQDAPAATSENADPDETAALMAIIDGLKASIAHDTEYHARLGRVHLSANVALRAELDAVIADRTLACTNLLEVTAELAKRDVRVQQLESEITLARAQMRQLNEFLRLLVAQLKPLRGINRIPGLAAIIGYFGR